nr:hypothetical protein [Halomonas sp.]
MTDSFDTTLMDMLWVLWAAALVFFAWKRAPHEQKMPLTSL